MNCAPCPAMMKQIHNEFKNSYRFQKYYSIMDNFNIEDIQGKNFKNGDWSHGSLNLYSTSTIFVFMWQCARKSSFDLKQRISIKLFDD